MSLAGHIAVYGGSFNPPHLGHQMACLYLLEGLGVQAVWVVPAWRHPFGKPLAPFAHRLDMCRLLAAGVGARVVVSDVEAELQGPGHTVDTLARLRARHPEACLALAIGSDILTESRQWHRWEQIVATIPLAVLRRGGYPLPPEHGASIALPEVSSTEVRERLRLGQPIEGLVPQAVVAYIEEHRLYRA